ncbi:MAG: hypothetical protein AB7F98_05015 [Novosphingobium sp.]
MAKDDDGVMAQVHVYDSDKFGKRNFLIENDRLAFGEIPLSSLTSTHIDHRFDFRIEDKWEVVKIVSTYDRFRTDGVRDFAIYATVEKNGPFLALIRSANN